MFTAITAYYSGIDFFHKSITEYLQAKQTAINSTYILSERPAHTKQLDLPLQTTSQ